jgi:intracellular sulfur oxidation DsrE/DsrF family protein
LDGGFIFSGKVQKKFGRLFAFFLKTIVIMLVYLIQIKSPILRLCYLEGVVNVVYQNGAILSLDDTFENKKSDVPGVIDAKITEFFICRRGLNRVAVFFSLVKFVWCAEKILDAITGNFQETSEFWAVSDGKIISQGTLKNGKCQLRGIGFDASTATLLSYCNILIIGYAL